MELIITDQVKTDDRLFWGKVPPQALEFERAVLGACLLERDTFEQVMEILPTPDCFYKESHQKLYTAMCELYNSGDVVDLLTVTERLRKNKALDIVGGAGELSNITISVLSSAHVEAHSRVIMEKYMLRQIIKTCGQATNDAYNEANDVFDLLSELEKSIGGILSGVSEDHSTGLGMIFTDMLMGIEEQRMRKSELLGIDTGFVELNRITLGFCKGDFVLLAARPSEGKTAMLLNFATNAVESKISPAGEFLIFSIESSKINLGRRFAASKTDIPLEAIRNGSINEIQESVLRSKIHEFHRLPIKIDDKTQELTKIVLAIRRAHKKYMKTQKGKEGLPFAVGLDYIQLVTVKGAKNEEQQVSEVSKVLKKLAIELDIIIIPLVQLNREVTKRTSNRPKPSDMRYSGQLEQDAQIILMIWHEDTGNGIETHLLVSKNKDGNCGDVKLRFNGDIQRWVNYEDFNHGRPASYLVRNPSEPVDGDWNNQF